jgi:UDP-N-acetylglucosamine--N-acetylmuramyl-(pentapeptide) pyrophosphoryl-undecaprenol N-acetylglucosamine transferase
MNNWKVIISGGGTGGHLFPALAIADALRARHPQAQIHFVGARGRMEMQRVPQAGYPIYGLWISGIQRSLSRRNLLFPFKLVHSLYQSWRILRRHRPQVVIGTGGYASGPLVFMASRMGIPSLLQEQNSYPGITNRWLAGRAARICVAYRGMERFFPAERLRLTGNPIRRDLCDPGPDGPTARKTFGLRPQNKTLLVLGGSLGARRINELVEACLPAWQAEKINVIWQCGKLYGAALRSRHTSDQSLHLSEFLEDMPTAFAAAHLVVSRAGAGTLSELAVVAKPAILVPSPNVAEDHQTHNARALEKAGGAVCFPETEDPETLKKISLEWLKDEDRQAAMQASLQQVAKPQATEAIVAEIEKIRADAGL